MPSIAKQSVRELLQRELGELGEVLPYMFRAVGACEAPGWYARVDGELLYLGGHMAIAAVRIAKLREAAA